MQIPTSRRGFLSGSAALATLGAARGAGLEPSAPAATGAIRLGVASYSFREFGRRLAIQYTKALRTELINVKDMHLPMGTLEEVKRASADFAHAGLTITGAGTISFPLDDDDDMRKKFEYVKNAGIPLIVGMPAKNVLPRLERFVKEYNIKVAIHNHGPEDKNFPSPFDVLKAIDTLDPRIGLCIDVGHTTRAGADPVAAVKAAGAKLYDMHIKDLADLRKRESDCVVGEGAMPISAIFQALAGIGFKGQVMLEYEIESDNPLPGMQRSFAYMRGVLAGMGLAC